MTGPLELSWVEKIFKKMTLVYGRDFMARWEGQEINEVIDDWAGELSGFDKWPEAIAWALQNLPAGKPPTVLEFRAICHRAPKPDRPALAEPMADKARVAKALDSMGPAPSYNRYTSWISAGLARLESGVKVTPGVERLIRSAAAAKGIA